MLVGDSLNRGQWISMLCLLESVIPAEKKSITPNAHLTIFRAEVQLLVILHKCHNSVFLVKPVIPVAVCMFVLHIGIQCND